ncbi:ketopantoate reductase PanE/ApbA C terminal-domain-containing protein [Lipomyces japonicus]|uniref:ketopantoate reductase PanE/ApbA C terminal-domain-containing protein n=1 Tax=Lipomyces japonicus TaxID=56871 RepID=UPI0034CF588E
MSENKLKVLAVGSNPISAFLSWRLSASNAADVTVVWKSQYDIVLNYGISFKSKILGTERFRPHAIVKSVDNVQVPADTGFDYVLLCVKALPDVYDMGAIIASVVTPGHTCIVVNTSVGIGIESYLEKSFPNNVVLSLVCDTSAVTQTAPAEFEHQPATSSVSSTNFWIGAASKNAVGDESLVADMAESFAATLEAGSVSCQVSPNIRQQQWENSIGSIAFHPLSVLLDEPNLTALLNQPHATLIINGLIAELISIARSQSCKFENNNNNYSSFIAGVIEQSTSVVKPSMMYQDFAAHRPLEIEVLVSNPLKIAGENKLSVPRLELIYALLSKLNQSNQTSLPPPLPSSSSSSALPPSTSHPLQPPFLYRQSPSTTSLRQAHQQPPPLQHQFNASSRRPPQQPGRRGPTPVGQVTPNGYSANSSPGAVTGLEEFSDVLSFASGPPLSPPSSSNNSNVNNVNINSSSSYNERELDLRRRELALREAELSLRTTTSRPVMPMRAQTVGPSMSMHDLTAASSASPAVNFDMLSVTSKRNRRQGSNLRGPFKMGDPFVNDGSLASRRVSNGFDKSPIEYYESFMESPLALYTSDRYHSVDTRALTADHSRANSLSSNSGQRQMYPTAYSQPQQQQQHPARSISSAQGFWRGGGGGAPQPPLPSHALPRSLSSMAGPSPMDALTTAVRTTHLQQQSRAPPLPRSPSSQIYAQQRNIDERLLYAAASKVASGGADHVTTALATANGTNDASRRSLTGSASASASTNDGNDGSGNSSSASSLEQK